MDGETVFIDHKKLESFVREVFLSLDFNQEEAANAAYVLLQSDLRGIESHGCARLPGYVRLVDMNIIKPNAGPFIRREYPSTAQYDGDGGLGLHLGQKAMDIAIEKADKNGSGWVSVMNSSHFGIAAAHAMKALEKGMIGFALTNASPLVSPAGGRERLLGTNPICYVFPTDKEEAFVCDMATTVVANGKLEVAKRKKQRIPFGYAQDAEGHPSDDPSILSKGGSMMPLGGALENSGYKGYALGSVVDIMTGVLSGANFGPWVPPFVPFLNNIDEKVGKGIGHFLGAWKIDAFMDEGEFRTRMDQWIERFRNSQPADGVERVLIPGEKEKIFERERTAKGIPIMSEVLRNLQALEQRFALKSLV